MSRSLASSVTKVLSIPELLLHIVLLAPKRTLCNLGLFPEWFELPSWHFPVHSSRRDQDPPCERAKFLRENEPPIRRAEFSAAINIDNDKPEFQSDVKQHCLEANDIVLLLHNALNKSYMGHGLPQIKNLTLTGKDFISVPSTLIR
ncbi:hypothetical protein MVEG_09208 [Podila verticillata NRRL 6337]|nr:hypothetical protein MVEG_09208 [Podila verticillata NRRL 6337]